MLTETWATFGLSTGETIEATEDKTTGNIITACYSKDRRMLTPDEIEEELF